MSQNILGVISILLNILRLVSWPRVIVYKWIMCTWKDVVLLSWGVMISIVDPWTTRKLGIPTPWAIKSLWITFQLALLIPHSTLEDPTNSGLYRRIVGFFFFFITVFKGYFPFTVITKYWLYSPCCTVHRWACLIPVVCTSHLPAPVLTPSRLLFGDP